MDVVIIGLFLMTLMGIAYWVMKHKKDNTSDYFLSGRSETWFAVGAALFCANIGSEHLVGLAGSGAETGMAMAHWEMQGWIILILGWVFVPFYAHSKVFTMPEFLLKRFNTNTSSFLSIITLISYILTKVSVTAYCSGVFLQAVTGIDSIWGIDFFWISAIGTVLITGLYTVLGGMKGIMMLSVVQTPILLAGAITILILGLLKVGDGTLISGWGEIVKYSGDHMHLIHQPGDDLYSQFPGIVVILSSAIIGFWYWCTDQAIVQRTLSARNMDQARKGTIFAGFLKIFPVFLFMIPGMIAIILKQKGIVSFESNDQAYGALVTTLLPVGVKGVVIVGFLCAIITSLAAHFNSSATLFTIDFYKHWRPNASEHRLVGVGRAATIAVVVLGLLWIPIMKNLGSVLYEYLQNVQSLIAPAIAAVFLMGVFSKKITPKAGEWGLIIGFCIGMFRLAALVFEPSWLQWFLDINWLWFCVYLFLFTIVVMVGISFFTKQAAEEQLQGLTYSMQSAEQRAEIRNSWSLWDIATSLGVLACCAAFYWYFW